ncbi:MAG: DMT family transporter, partial [Patescibacteria group bacterium]
ILIGLVGGGIPFLLFFKGLSLSTAATGSFIHKTMFLYVTILAFFFLKEKIDKKLIFAIFLLLFGNAFLLKLLPIKKLNVGDLLVFLAVLFWSVEQILAKKAVIHISPRLVAWGRMFFGLLIIIGFWLITNQFSLIFTLNLKQILWVVLTSFLLFGYVLTWYSGIKYLPISTATCLLALGSPITTLLDLTKGKIINWQEIVGSILIALAIFIILLAEKIQFKIVKLGKIKL